MRKVIEPTSQLLWEVGFYLDFIIDFWMLFHTITLIYTISVISSYSHSIYR